MATKITIINNGSLRIEGDYEVYDERGYKFDIPCQAVISLCRCGQSSRKPFCDGSHGKCGFQSEVIATMVPTKDIEIE